MRDATEYQFVAGDRRVMVRSAEPGTEVAYLRAAARDYADQWKQFLGATDVAVSEVAKTPQGAEAVRVSATLPDGLLRAALLRFAGGPLVELALVTGPGDAAAAEEFERLLASARPAAPEPTEAVARALAAGPRGAAGYPAGPLVLDLPSDYAAPRVFALASIDGGERYTLERAEGGEGAVARATGAVPVLATGIETAVGEDGLPVQFEVPPPTPAPRRVAAAPAPAATTGEAAATTAAEGGPPVLGKVRGTEVRVRFAGPGASTEQAERLIRALNASN